MYWNTMVWPQMPTSHAYYLLFIDSRSQIIATLPLCNLERFICYHFCTYKRGHYHGSLETDLLNKTALFLIGRIKLLLRDRNRISYLLITFFPFVSGQRTKKSLKLLSGSKKLKLLLFVIHYWLRGSKNEPIVHIVL